MKKLNCKQFLLAAGAVASLSGCASTPAPAPAPPPTAIRNTQENTTRTISSEPVVGQPPAK
jgi:hypothetical protein